MRLKFGVAVGMAVLDVGAAQCGGSTNVAGDLASDGGATCVSHGLVCP